MRKWIGAGLYTKMCRQGGTPLSLAMEGLRLSNKTSWRKKQLNQERRWKGKDVPERGASVAKEGKARNSIVCIGNYIEVNGTRRASLK